MNENEIRTYRLSHLSILLTQTLHAISHDNISQQMDKHDVSSKYTEDRLLEVFQTLLNHEREELIFQTELQIQTLTKDSSQSKQKIKNNLSSINFTIQAISATNYKMRTKVGEAHALLFGRKWKRDHIQKSENLRINRLQQQFDIYRPSLVQIRSNVLNYKLYIDDLRYDLNELIFQYSKTFSCAKKKILKKFSDLSNIDISIISLIENKIADVKNDTKINKYALRKLYQIVTKQETKDFTGDEINIFQNKIKQSKKDDNLQKYRLYADSVKKKLSKGIKIQDKIYNPILSKQRNFLDRLKRELSDTSKRLQALISSDSAIDRRFLKQIEASKNEMTNAQNKTDTIMIQLQKISFSSTSSII